MTSKRAGLHLIVCDDRPLLLESMVEWLSGQPGVAKVTWTSPDQVAALPRGDEGAVVLLWTASCAHAQLRELLLSRVEPDGARPVLVVLSGVVAPELALALFTGAASAVGGDICPVALMAAARQVASGQVVLPAEVAASALRLDARQRAERRGKSTRARLTSREVLILQFLADGVDRAEVARSLSLSPNTVRTHIANLMTKLDAHSQVELAAKARQQAATDAIGNA